MRFPSVSSAVAVLGLMAFPGGSALVALRRVARSAAAAAGAPPLSRLYFSAAGSRPSPWAGSVVCFSATPEQPGLSLQGLKKEVNRQVLRQLKRVGKAEVRVRRAEEEGGEWNGQLLSDHEADLAAANGVLAELERLEEDLRGTKNLSEELAGRARDLGVSDKPPPSPPRGPGKTKGPRGAVAPRKPYKTYVSSDGIEIRVGRTAKDNDLLSLKPEFRDSRNWWLHASGCPGSHVVIRCVEEDLPKDTVLDAAALAAKYSKASGSRVKVSLTRCRNISKPPGAKPGLVNLSGDVRTVKVDMRTEASRLERLEGEGLLQNDCSSGGADEG